MGVVPAVPPLKNYVYTVDKDSPQRKLQLNIILHISKSRSLQNYKIILNKKMDIRLETFKFINIYNQHKQCAIFPKKLYKF